MDCVIIDGFKNYSIDILGNVMNIKTGRLMAKNTCKSGFYKVNLSRDSINYSLHLHRLLAISFIDNPDGKTYVRHKDHNKKNNDLSNLEWVTKSEYKSHDLSKWVNNFVGLKNFDEKIIVGFEEYSVDIYGNIRNVRYNRPMTKSLGTSGYYSVSFFKNGRNFRKYVHRLVAEAFIPNPENKRQVNHIDCNKLNNDVKNLEWCTSSENANHAIIHGLFNPRGETNPTSKLSESDVNIIRKYLKDGIINHKQISNIFNVSRSAITDISRGRTWSHLPTSKDFGGD